MNVDLNHLLVGVVAVGVAGVGVKLLLRSSLTVQYIGSVGVTGDLSVLVLVLATALESLPFSFSLSLSRRT